MGGACSARKGRRHTANKIGNDKNLLSESKGRSTNTGGGIQLKNSECPYSDSNPLAIFQGVPKIRNHAQPLVASSIDIYSVYDISSTIIGSGNYGTVRIGVLLNDPTKRFAIKSVAKSKIKDNKRFFLREIDILKNLDHPNVAKFYEVYEDVHHYHLVMEYCSGGELREYMGDLSISENRKREIMRKLILAVKYLHSRGICHRDIKPENFLFQRDSSNSHELKIIDFGLSTYITQSTTEVLADTSTASKLTPPSQLHSQNQQISPSRNPQQKQNQETKDHSCQNEIYGDEGILDEICGTPQYIAPEVIKGKYDHRCDIWSIGVLFHQFLTGVMPYEGDTKAEVFSKVQSFSLSFKDKYLWGNTSYLAKEFLRKFLVSDPDQRISLSEALEHPWLQYSSLTSTTSSQSQILSATRIRTNKNWSTFISEDVLRKLLRTTDKSESIAGKQSVKFESIGFRTIALRVLVRFLEDEETFSYKEVFRRINTSNTGILTGKEICIAAQLISQHEQTNTDQTEATKILNGSNEEYPNNLEISYSEFLATIIEIKQQKILLDRLRLSRVFKFFDTNNTQYISTNNLKDFFARACITIQHDQLLNLINSAKLYNQKQQQQQKLQANQHEQVAISSCKFEKVENQINWEEFCELFGVNPNQQFEQNCNQSVLRKESHFYLSSYVNEGETDIDALMRSNLGTPSILMPSNQPLKYSFEHSTCTFQVQQLHGSPWVYSSPIENYQKHQQNYLVKQFSAIEEEQQHIQQHNQLQQQQQEQSEQLNEQKESRELQPPTNSIQDDILLESVIQLSIKTRQDQGLEQPVDLNVIEPEFENSPNYDAHANWKAEYSESSKKYNSIASIHQRQLSIV